MFWSMRLMRRMTRRKRNRLHRVGGEREAGKRGAESYGGVLGACQARESALPAAFPA